MLLQRTDSMACGADWGPLPPPARYGSSPRPRLAAIGATAAVHVVFALALLGLGIRATHQESARIVAVNLTPGSKAEQPEPEQVPPPSPTQPRRLETAILPPRVPVAVVRPAIAIAPAMAQPAAVPQAAPAAPAAQPAEPAPAPPAQPAAAQSGDLGARILSAPPPRYPVQSRRRREQGTVELLLTLDTDGSVETIAVHRSSGFERLDDAALSAVRRWRWEPTVQAGTPVKVRGVVAIPFQLT
ncbi:energy transducer TonB [Croceibacterium ferulae]|uniref:energy transducer TonB n=1 Tax=Croceibacterium ferulae TaxID=1854641 RepID=UPI000EB18B6B|nr:energy transducer TonB [Croceibacterium ferulae]